MKKRSNIYEFIMKSMLRLNHDQSHYLRPKRYIHRE